MTIVRQATKGLVVEVREEGEQLDHYQRRMELVKVTKECTPQESKTLEESWLVLESKQPNEVVVRDKIHELTKDDLKRLEILRQLNGDVINFYLHILCEAVNALEGVDVHIMPTTFFSLLVRRGKTKNGDWTCNYAGVRRWLLLSHVLFRHLVLYPIHVHGNHWALISVRKEPGTYDTYKVCFWDSMAIKDDWFRSTVTTREEMDRYEEVFIKMYEKLIPEASVYYIKYGYEVNPTPHVDHDVCDTPCPQQNDPASCGVFMCANAYCLVHSLNMNTFSSEEIANFFRKHMHLTLRQRSLHDLIKYPAISSD